MADYTAISAGETNPGAPLTSSLVKRLEANPRAIAEGAPGAPRVRTSALVAPAAGNVVLARYANSSGATVVSTNTAYGNPADVTRGSAAVFQVLRGGTVRAAVEHRANVAFGQARVRVLRNTTVMQEWSTSSDSYSNRSIDFSVSAGDWIVFQQRVTDVGQSIWRNVRVMSNSQNLAVI